MRRKRFLICVFLVALGVLTGVSRFADAQEFYTAKPKILFLYFENTSGFDRGNLDDELYKRLSDSLALNGYAPEPIEPFKKTLKEKKLSALLEYKTLLDVSLIARLGKLARADKVLYGEITSYDEDFSKNKARVWLQAQFFIVDAPSLSSERNFEVHVLSEIEGKKKGADARKQAYEAFFKQFLLRFENKTEDESAGEVYIGNTTSGLFHSQSLNHLPKPEYQVLLHGLKEAGEKGFKPCLICFPALHASTEAAGGFEMQLGQEIAGIVEHYYRIYRDEKLAAYVDNVGQKLAQTTPRRNLRFIFTLLNTDEVNAFATAAGYIYVTKGLLDAVESEDELAGVLSHEIAHIVRKHAVTQYKRAANLSFIGAVGTVLSGGAVAADALSNFAQALILNGYDRKYEREADELALVYLLKAGYDAQEYIRVIHKLHDLEKSEPSKIEVYFRSHPPAKERLKRAEEFINTRAQLSQLLDDELKSLP